jgi:ABC-2 type transport system permease protein
MKILRVFAISKKEFYQIKRDKISLALSFLMPLLLLFLFGYAISFDVKDVKTIVLDEDKSFLSRDLILKFSNSNYFKIINFSDKEKEIDYFISSKKAMVGVWIPSNFSKNLKKNIETEVQIIIDGSDSNTASIVLNYINIITKTFLNKDNPLINLKTRFWYNQDLKSKNFIIPGLIALIIAIISALLSSLTISREWERGTMERLISTPVEKEEIILGKLIPYFIIGAIDLTFSVLIACFFFNVPFKGNLIFLIFISSIFLFGGLSFGILISSISKSQVLSIQISIVSTFLPTLLLSGFIFSIENMPKVIQKITYIVPARYFIFIVRNIFLKGSPLNFLLFESLILILFSGFFFFIGLKKFKKELD